MRSHIVAIQEGTKHSFFASFDNALSKSDVSDALVTSGFAYATLGGVRHFISCVEHAANWKPIPKQFVIGIHHGITEPSALELLREVPQSELRIYIPGRRLNADALVSTPLFHPKMIAISNADVTTLRYLQAGSANLTSAAIGEKPRNYEMTVAIEADDGASLSSSRTYLKWWSGIWKQSRVVDKSIIKSYAAIRLAALERNPILRHAAGPPSDISGAENFFIEVGAGSGPPGQRHQVEFPEAIVAFFGKPARRRRDLELCRGANSWSDRPLSYKTTTYGVEIWRLGMPTQSTNGDPIANRVIRFQRTNTADRFVFEVVDANSARFRKWQRDANTLGHLGATHGQRPRIYGFY